MLLRKKDIFADKLQSAADDIEALTGNVHFDIDPLFSTAESAEPLAVPKPKRPLKQVLKLQPTARERLEARTGVLATQELAKQTRIEKADNARAALAETRKVASAKLMAELRDEPRIQKRSRRASLGSIESISDSSESDQEDAHRRERHRLMVDKEQELFDFQQQEATDKSDLESLQQPPRAQATQAQRPLPQPQRHSTPLLVGFPLLEIAAPFMLAHPALVGFGQPLDDEGSALAGLLIDARLSQLPVGAIIVGMLSTDDQPLSWDSRTTTLNYLAVYKGKRCFENVAVLDHHSTPLPKTVRTLLPDPMFLVATRQVIEMLVAQLSPDFSQLLDGDHWFPEEPGPSTKETLAGIKASSATSTNITVSNVSTEKKERNLMDLAIVAHIFGYGNSFAPLLTIIRMNPLTQGTHTTLSASAARPPCLPLKSNAAGTISRSAPPTNTPRSSRSSANSSPDSGSQGRRRSSSSPTS